MSSSSPSGTVRDKQLIADSFPCPARPPSRACAFFAVLSQDNLVMIQAGQYIDSTIGVSLGLATMTAAAAGQVVSDVSGVVFGGTLEQFLTRMSLIRSPDISPAQRQLPICRHVAMAGAVVGVVFGCALGAMTLLLVDLDARHRIERANQLREIVTDMISEEEEEQQQRSPSSRATTGKDDAGLLSIEGCTVYIANSHDFDIDEEGSEDAKKKNWRTSMKLLKDAATEAVRECASEKRAILSDNRHFLCVPIMDGDDVLAVIELRHSRPSPSTRPKRRGARSTDSGGFSEHDVRTAKVMARHVAIFMNRIVE